MVLLSQLKRDWPYLFGKKQIRLRMVDESKGILVAGDTGVGKSHVIRQLITHLRRRGDIAVILDSKLEFIPEFYNPRLNDKILSPKDNRCIYWDMPNEFTDEADAITCFRSFFPTIPSNPQANWFNDQACRIMAYLAVSKPRPSCQELGYWLSNTEEIYKRIKGSEYMETLDKSAAGQNKGILGTMNQIGFVLRMMPAADEKWRERFTIRGWNMTREGFLFLPNTLETREALRPAQSAWIDMAILRVMSAQKQVRRVWIILDELESLNTLSQLQAAMTQMRSTKNVMVLGFQNIQQLEDRYGRQSRTIFSQAGSKYILAVSEPESAESLSKLVGDQEIRKYRESRSGSMFGTKDRNNYSGPEDHMRRLILPSEISGLPDLRGYFVQRPVDEETGLHVVNFALDYMPPVKHCLGLVERKIPETSRAAPQQPTDPKQPIPDQSKPASKPETSGPRRMATISRKDLLATPFDKLPRSLKQQRTKVCPNCNTLVTASIQTLLRPCPSCGQEMLRPGEKQPEIIEYESDRPDTRAPTAKMRFVACPQCAFLMTEELAKQNGCPKCGGSTTSEAGGSRSITGTDLGPQKRAAIPAKRQSRVDGCELCKTYEITGGPGHDPSPNCRSGKRPHCSCDTCY